MDDQIILVSDEQGNFTGEYIPKEVGHTGEGKHHLAITVLLYNSKGQVLLQQRKHKVFDDIWDFTGSTHPIHKGGGQDESFEDATLRCLKREYDVDDVKVEKVGAFNYFADYGQLCENEHCAMMIGKYDGELKMNPEVGYSYKWMDKQEFLADIEENPQKYAPWTVEGTKLLKNQAFLF